MQLLIRADASAKIGTGHVMRCLALAQAWQSQGGAVTFLMANTAPALAARLQAEQVTVIHHPTPQRDETDSAYTIQTAQSLQTNLIVVDGYHFGSTYQRDLKAAGLKVLFMDDNGHAKHYYADWVLNPNIHAHEGLYLYREPYTQLLLGTSYVLLRKEFWPWRGWQRQITSKARKILVTLGGSDPDNVTLQVMQSLQQMPELEIEVVVVIGGSNPHFDILSSKANDSLLKFDLRQNVDNMPELMAAADIAISGGGTTCLELAFMKLPSILLSLAENQRANTQGLAKLQQALNLGPHQAIQWPDFASMVTALIHSQDRRKSMAQSGAKLVDGHGADHIVRSLLTGSIKLRSIEHNDVQLTWEWSNEPVTRAASFTGQDIPWIDHYKWFTSKLKDPDCYFFIALHVDSSKPIGQVRYEADDQEATISLSIAEAFRGKGYGCSVVLKSCQYLKQRSPIRFVNAYIKPDNLPSTKVFSKAGFRCVGECEIKGQKALKFVKDL